MGFRTGVMHPRWKGGTTVTANGYVRIKTKLNRERYEHRVVIENLLGRPIPPGMQVHHLDWNRRNNHPTNLLLCDAAINRMMALDTKEVRR